MGQRHARELRHVQLAGKAVGGGDALDIGQDVQHFAHASAGQAQHLGRHAGRELVVAQLLAGQRHVRRRAGAELHHLRDAAADLLVPGNGALDLFHAYEDDRHLGPVGEVAHLFQHGGIGRQGELGLVDDDGALTFHQHAQTALEQGLRRAAPVDVQGLAQLHQKIFGRPVHVGAQIHGSGFLGPAVDDVRLAVARLAMHQHHARLGGPALLHGFHTGGETGVVFCFDEGFFHSILPIGCAARAWREKRGFPACLGAGVRSRVHLRPFLAGRSRLCPRRHRGLSDRRIPRPGGSRAARRCRHPSGHRGGA